MTYTKTTWVDNTTPVDAAKMNNIEAGIAVRDGYGTTLPGSPVDGQEHVLVDNVSTPSYQWRFRYNAGSTNPWKWEFIGGTEWMTSSGSNPGSIGPGWIELAAPAVTIPRSGYYKVESCIDQGGSSGGGLVAQGPNLAGQPSPPFYSQNTIAGASAGVGWSPAKAPMQLNAGQVLKVFVYAASFTLTISQRWITITPMVVS